MKTKELLHIVTFPLTVVGALNWGLVGLFNFNLVSALLGTVDELEKLVYVMVGISAVYIFATHGEDCRICGKNRK